MSEEFGNFLENGIKAFSDRRTAREFVKTINDPNLLVNYLEQNDVGEMIGTKDPKSKVLTSPLLTRDDVDNSIKLQTYISTLSNVAAGKEIVERLQIKYPGFSTIPSTIRGQMVQKLIEKYGLKMTKPTQSRAEEGSTGERRLMAEYLGLFSNRKTGRDLTLSALSSASIDGRNLILDSDAPELDRKKAIEFFKEHSESQKLSPLVAMLERSLVSGSRITQPSDVLQEFISKGDLRFTVNRQKIYKYWEGINEKYEAFVTAHNQFKEGLSQAFSEEDRKKPETPSELIKYINAFESANPSDLKYVFKYESVRSTTIDSKDKSLEALDNFLDAIREAPPERYTTSSGFSQTEESSTGQTAAPKRDKETGAVSFTGEMDSAVGQENIVTVNKIERFRDLIESNILDIKLDPLYAYAYETGSAGFKITPAMKGDLQRLTNRVKKTAIMLELSNSALRELDRYMKDIKMKTVISDGDFFLPYQEELIGRIRFDKDPPKSKTNAIRKYLDNISKFISAGQEAERGTGIGVRQREVVEGVALPGAKETGVALPSKGRMRSQLDKLNADVKITETTEEDGKKTEKVVNYNLQKVYENLLDKINDYFVQPATSDSKPLARRFEWMDTTTLTILGSRRKNSNAFLTMLSLQRSNIDGILLDESSMGSVVTVLQALSKPVSSQNVDSFMRLLRNTALAVDEVFKGDDSRAVSIEFGNLGYSILSRNSISTDIEFGIGEKKKLKFWKDEYDKSSSTIYPFAALYYHILLNENLYRKYGGQYPSLISRIKRIEDKLDIIKSEMEVKYLHAHDTIRKMMKKPLYYGISSVNDFDDMQETISIMKSKFNTDLTAMEVEGIVSEIDSMQNLSSKYGISTEGVYYLKAIHR